VPPKRSVAIHDLHTDLETDLQTNSITYSHTFKKFKAFAISGFYWLIRDRVYKGFIDDIFFVQSSHSLRSGGLAPTARCTLRTSTTSATSVRNTRSFWWITSTTSTGSWLGFWPNGSRCLVLVLVSSSNH